MTPMVSGDNEVWDWVQAQPSHSFLRVYLDYARTQTPAHFSVHAINALVLCGASAPTALVGRGTGFVADTHAPIYGLVVGSTGSWKTQSQNVAMRLLRASALQEYCSPRPASAESLHKGLSEQPHAVISYPEFSTFLAATSGTDGMGTRLRVAMIDAFDCESYETSGLRSGKFTVTDPRLSLFAACAPAHIATHTTQDDFSGGFLNRFLVAHAEAPAYNENWQREQDTTLQTWLVDWLSGSRERPIGACNGMSPDAYAMWRTWRSDWNKVEATLSTIERDTAARTPMLAMRIAVIAAWARGAPCAPVWHIEASDIYAGLGAALLHTTSCRALLGAVPRTNERREINLVLSAIRDDWTALGKITHDSHLGKRKVVQHLETLEEEGKVARSSQNSTVFFKQVHGQPMVYDNTIVHLPPPPMLGEA